MSWKAVFENPTSDAKMEKARRVYGQMRLAAKARDWDRVVEIWHEMPRGSFLVRDTAGFRTLEQKARRLQQLAYEATRRARGTA